MDELGNILQYIDLIEVGPARLEKNRLAMPYKIIVQQQSFQTELIYKYNECVFDKSLESENLAGTIGSQVAINYGLFAKKILYKGVFTRADRKFIKDMTDITSNEILVHKVLKPNIYIKDEIKTLIENAGPVFSRAVIEFEEVRAEHGMLDKHNSWPSNDQSYLVLSSGGKDSLLGFSLLNELGHDIHPVFVNESGRHWFTSLNAYRYFRDNIQNTAKVWTNSDRVFNFFLRHLPFIKKDFSKISSDDYPVRLWTVAVFIFGVLPLAKKRKIARLIIGDEYDTTYKLSYRGVTHYNAVYDQGRYFDNAFTRYYMEKGYNICQFSILRNLSELMIQNILCKRYPEMQKLQVSCHSAIVDGDLARPCGKCEKCRRIISMLSAIGGDPKNNGYDDEHINNGIKAFALKKSKQEMACIKHTIYLLGKAGLIDAKTEGLNPKDEVMAIRFDREKSPFATMPFDIRGPLYSIYSKYCTKTLVKEGRSWIEIDLLKHPLFKKPYPFNTGRKKTFPDRELKKLPFLWGELKWTEAKSYLETVDLALLPVGSIEQHGPHLPLDTDAFDAEYIAIEVARKCRAPRPLVLPLIPYGVSYHHEDFPGTVSISPETLFNIVYDIGISIAKNGITKLVIINGHGGNSPALNMAAQKINRDAHIFTCVDSGGSSDADIAELIETPNDVHAGETETSTSLANRKELVDMAMLKSFVPSFSSLYLNYTNNRSINWYARTAKLSKSGVLGDPGKASLQKGIAIWEIVISNLVKFVEELKNKDLDEIYQKKY